MGKLIGSGNSDNYGENTFIEKAKSYFDDDTIIYWNRQIYGREFDICILLPGKGILVVEVKGWREENILRVDDNNAVVISTKDGEIFSSPQRQARGYRYLLERFVRTNIQRRPLVFQMVALPQVSRQFFGDKRLDIAMEERFTFLREDLSTPTLFFHKLDQALREVCSWNRESFDSKLMIQVRGLFESDLGGIVETDSEQETVQEDEVQTCDYSRFYYFAQQEDLSECAVGEMVAQYMQGCKLYCVFPNHDAMALVISSIDDALMHRGLVRSRDDLSFALEAEQKHQPELSSNATSFMAFHCSMSVVHDELGDTVASFMIQNGITNQEQKEMLERLGDVSQFNVQQYMAEHADVEKNIVIRAGAGTGKTYTMIARIAYVCFTQKVMLSQMAERITMITFTNQAADHMKEDLKRYFQNCYLLTGRTDYLDMVSCVDHMQISTIHSYAKMLIAKLGSSFGYGIDVRITSSEYNRRKKITDLLDEYIQRNEKKYGQSYVKELGMPVYAIRDCIVEFVGRLQNKSVDIGALAPSSFGSISGDAGYQRLHELLADVIPAVEREYYQELLEENRLHLGTIISLLYRFICSPESIERIDCLKPEEDVLQFLFVDEFQDTDDTQIDTLVKLAEMLNFRMFLVGDIKQCIYRFRGAEEKSFDHLNMDLHPEQWEKYELTRNYRTDKTLLDLFDRSFALWGSMPNGLLSYCEKSDRLLGTRDYNGYLPANTGRYFTCITAHSEEQRMQMLVSEIERIQRRIQYETNKLKMKLSPKEQSICILVRENWQAEMVRTACTKLRPNLTIRTTTGGDLYMSQPALDMMTLVNALVHFDEAEYLYQLVCSNFFGINMPRSNLYLQRKDMLKESIEGRPDRYKQVNRLIECMNTKLSNLPGRDSKWEYVITSLRTKPVLQVLRSLYSTLQPWCQYSSDEWKQHYYQLNVDLLFEQLINACNVDRVTINTLQEHLYHCITACVQVDSRAPGAEEKDAPIQCITVHKSKGLEYGHVIMPFCSASIDYMKQNKLQVSAVKDGEEIRIGYRMTLPENAECIQNDYYNDSVEKEEKIREEARILYVAMTRSIRSFSWIQVDGKRNLSWQNLIWKGE